MTNKSKGILAIVGPILLLIIVLTAFAASQFIFAQMGAGQGSETTANIIRMVLSLLGIISIFAFMIGLPYGLIIIGKPDMNQITPEMRHQYQGLSDGAIAYIHGGSLGAFFGAPIWALGNKLWLWAFLGILPLIGLFVSIYLAIRGREMAWKKGGWNSIEDFKRRQSVLGWIIGIVVILSIALQAMISLGSL